MKACAPKTKKISMATHGVVVSANARWVSVSTISPIRMMLPRLICWVIQP